MDLSALLGAMPSSSRANLEEGEQSRNNTPMTARTKGAQALAAFEGERDDHVSKPYSLCVLGYDTKLTYLRTDRRL